MSNRCPLYHTIDPATIVNDIEVQVRDTVYQFTVVASGTSPLMYTWYINNVRYNGVPEDAAAITVPMNFTTERTIEVTVLVANGVGATFTDTSTIVLHVIHVGECLCIATLPTCTASKQCSKDVTTM